MSEESLLSTTPDVSLKDSHIKKYRSLYLFAVALGTVVLLTLVYSNVQWNKPDLQHLLYRNSAFNTAKTEFSSLNRSELSKSSDYYFSRYQNGQKFSSKTNFLNVSVYSEDIFRSSSSPPVLWVDSLGDVHWNEAAEREIYIYLANKQTINESMTEDQIIDECLRRQFFVILQHEWGFFSRYHCFIEQFGQTLYSPWMTLVTYNRFRVSNAGRDDFLSEGMLRYFEPISTCSKYSRHPRMKPIEQRLRGNNEKSQGIQSVHQLTYDSQVKENKKYSILDTNRVWSFGYEHVPLRRWMFSYKRFPPTYNLSVEVLTKHTDEHIYKEPSLKDDFLAKWTPRNRPWGQPDNHLPGNQYKLTWQDRVFTGFLRYIFVVYFHRYAPRIHQMTHLLAEYWSTYLIDKSGQLLNSTAAIFIRRGDKMGEDSFWRKHGRWRNISMYVKGLVDEEKRQNRTFSSVFVMTDDVSVMTSIQDYSDPKSNGKDEPYAREHLRNRQILNNVYAPQACFDPFLRIGFDQFLVSMEFIVQYSQFTVGHSDSNVGRYLEEITYGRNQLKASAHSDSFVKNAPDSL